MYVKASELRDLLVQRQRVWVDPVSLSLQSGVSDRAIRRIMNGGSTITRHDVAERLLDACGLGIWEMAEAEWTHCRRISGPDRRAIVSRIKAGETQTSLAREYGVNPKTIYRIYRKGIDAES